MASTRRSTRQRKQIVIQEYRFGSSDDDDNVAPSNDSPSAEDDDGSVDGDSTDEVLKDADTDPGSDDDMEDIADGVNSSSVARGQTRKRSRAIKASSSSSSWSRPKQGPHRRQPPISRRRRAAPPPADGAGAEQSSALVRIMPHDPHPASASATSYLPLDTFPSDIRHTRMYCGPIPRNMTGYSLVQHLAGPDAQEIAVLGTLVKRWFNHHVFPGKVPGSGAEPVGTPWVGEGFESEMDAKFVRWYEAWRTAKGARRQVAKTLADDEAAMYEFGGTQELAVLLGPYDAQTEYRFRAGSGCCIDLKGSPCATASNVETKVETQKANAETETHGWLFDVGGFVLTLDWMPCTTTARPQVLALSVIPFSDRNVNRDPTAVDAAVLTGCVQLWEFGWAAHRDGYVMPARAAPVKTKTLCMDWGRVRSVKWCPVPMPDALRDDALGLMAVLTGDGAVRVLKVETSGGTATCDKIQEPMAILSVATESIPATAFTWVNMNRICIGHADGSLTLWSLFPRVLLSRHPVAHTHILNLQSAYPSSPYIVTVAPIAGLLMEVDLRNPSSETTSATAMAINTQPSTMCWSEHMQGFVSLGASSNPHSTGVVMLPLRHFGALGRRILRPGSPPTCVAVGATHPHVMVGLVDGTVWATNPMRLIFAAKSTTAAHKLCVLQHEFKPRVSGHDDGSGPLRGAARLVTGWKAEPNRTTQSERTKAGGGDADGDADGERQKKRKTKTTRCPVSKNTLVSDMNRERGVVYEPQTRITAVAWNPNPHFGCWGAVAMGSGLVRVMDLGVS